MGCQKELVFDKTSRVCYFILHILGGFVIVGWKNILYIIGQALDNFCD